MKTLATALLALAATCMVGSDTAQADHFWRGGRGFNNSGFSISFGGRNGGFSYSRFNNPYGFGGYSGYGIRSGRGFGYPAYGGGAIYAAPRYVYPSNFGYGYGRRCR